MIGPLGSLDPEPSKLTVCSGSAVAGFAVKDAAGAASGEQGRRPAFGVSLSCLLVRPV